MATYFSNCSDNEENFNLCIQHNVAGFTSPGYEIGDLIYLIHKKNNRWYLGAKGVLQNPTTFKPWPDSENYKSAFEINWEVIDKTDITDTLKKIYHPNFGLAIQGKKDLEKFQNKGDEFQREFSAFFQNSITKENIKMENQSPKDVINHIYNYIMSKGFFFTEEEVGNFYLSLKTKPFVILAGISGTGKTQLPRKFAEAIGMKKKQVIQVPVRPDWNDPSDLIGYTSLEGKFVSKPLIQAVIKANEDPDNPYFFILDEMNLARVEHYFSDFLSLIETREFKNNQIITDPLIREESIFDLKDKEIYGNLMLPENLYLIGTVNMDETTHAFSRKVLDRANSIEMNGIDLYWKEHASKGISALKGIGQNFFKTEYLSSKDLSSSEKKSVDSYLQQLISINKILEKADLHFAYRVRDEIAFYLILNQKFQIFDSNTALDFQLMQKILPRIHGSSKRVQTVLVELLNFLENRSFNATDFDLGEIGEFGAKPESFKFRKSTKKIIFMLERFEDDRFTSFWV